MSTMARPASSYRSLRAVCVASVVPLPGSDRPRASVRQFIELAVNMPEQEPQVGQAASSMLSRSSSETESLTASAMAEIRFRRLRTVPSTRMAVPPSIGPPETNTVGMFRRMAAIIMPGVILSQLEMQISASAQCALTMYSTESAIKSRRGQRVQHAAVAHGDPVVHGDGVEFARDSAGLDDGIGDDAAHRLQVGVAGDEFGEAVRDGDDRLSEVGALDAGGAEQGAGADHVAAVGDCS